MKRKTLSTYLFNKRLFFVTILLVVLIISATSCSGNEVDYPYFDNFFIRSFADPEELSDYHISELVCYFNDGYYYYDVVFTIDDDSGIIPENDISEMVFIFSSGQRDNSRDKMNPSLTSFFNIQNAQDCYTYFPSEYDALLKAKQEGVKRKYSQEEIQKLITDYQTSTEALIND